MKKAVITLVVIAGIAGAGYGAYKTGYLEKYGGKAISGVQSFAGKYLGKVIPALQTSDETEAEGRVSSTDPDAVYLDSVSTLANLGTGDGQIERFAGAVEAQETKKYSIASGRTVDKTYVQEGDEVRKGDKLFTYDIDEMKDKLEQAKIDLERLQNQVDVSEAKEKELEKQQSAANTPEKKIQALQEQNNLKQQKLELKSRQNKIDSINQQIDNSTVVSDIDGIVKAINQNAATGSSDDTYDYSSGGDNSTYITLLKVGTYRVKASANEQNIGSIFVGERVLVHSRVDSSVMWQGTVSQIKTDQDTSSSDDSSISSSSDEAGSTDYPFYVELDSSDGLMLGQHVYLEQDVGQGNQRDGIWLDDYYFATDEDGSTYVWAASDDNKLEKRKVKLGEKDEEQQKTEVVSGLSADDYICMPSDNLQEGLPVAYNGLDTGDYTDPEDYTYEETEDYSGLEEYGSPFIGTYDSTEEYEDLSLDDSGFTGSDIADDGSDLYTDGEDLVPIDESEYSDAEDWDDSDSFDSSMDVLN